jgi:type I restriction enzyme S subunit
MFFASNPGDDWVISTGFAVLRPNTELLEPRFLYACVSNQAFTEYLITREKGAAYPAVSPEDIANAKIPFPPLPEQRAIAHILGTLDDKIELNRRMSQTLEEMARAIFKSWFVDFDPVRAKAAVRREHPNWTNAQVSRAACPNLKPETAELFPDCFVDSELGEIPEGWSVGILSELIEVNPVRSLRKGHIAPYLDMANMPTKGHSPDQVTNRSFGSGMRFMNGDTLVARITPCLENGKTAFVDFLQEGQIGWGSTEFIVLRPKPPLPEEFAYCLARSSTFREFAIKSMTGSSGRQRVPAESLSHFQLVAPSKPIAEAFGIQVKPLFERAKIALQELRITTALRDVVLPKLISGEIRINDAEKFLRERDL